MKTTYVMRDGELVEKDKAAPEARFVPIDEPVYAMRSYLEGLSHRARYAMIHGLWPPEDYRETP